ncbi:DUF1638 domain-containing protein [Desulfosporosinus sp. PR]|uniref:DUF1638 domain-containing protein n=1 Tax=Candidatus Desulfosporosinus nitrosoreducens TaxID=3401928 RepID=UPI0027E9BB7F|nr:DUF1638 domain-containing protein [Desulfosporosinus sp. PR]MDQ7097182.1 DUF1638 domain-containing protein [Desulfosporosinus sp. PR]
MRIVACGIFQLELEHILDEIKAEWASAAEIKVTYTEPALHVDYDSLKDSLTTSLTTASEEKLILFLGSMCHPEIGELSQKRCAARLQANNCIEAILGKKVIDDMQHSSNIFCITPGWLQNWEKIFRQGQGWDEIDARQNFGFYDKILLLDTGVSELNEIDILEFFEYTQVPIETQKVELDILKKNVVETLRKTFSKEILTY